MCQRYTSYMWITYALAAAGLNVFENLLRRLRKGYADPLLFAWLIYSFAAPISVAAFFLGGGEVVAFSANTYLLFASIVVICAITAVALVKAFQSSEVSLIVPILTFLPAFLVVSGYVMLGELPSTVGLVGVLLTVVGAYYIHAVGARAGILTPIKNLGRDLGSLLMLMSVFLWSISTNLEKQLYVSGHSAEFISMVIYVGIWVVLSALIIVMRKKGVIKILQSYWLVLLGIALSSVIIYILQTKAVGTAPTVSYAMAIKRLDVPLTVIAAWAVYREAHFTRRLAGGSIMVIGAWLIYFYG